MDAENLNFLVHESSVSTLRKLFIQNDLSVSQLNPNNYKIPYCHENSLDLIVPILFCSALTISQNPNVINIVCGIIANYTTDFFKGIKKEPTIKLSVVIESEKNKKTKKITYEGNVNGLKELVDTVKEIVNEKT